MAAYDKREHAKLDFRFADEEDSGDLVSLVRNELLFLDNYFTVQHTFFVR